MLMKSRVISRTALLSAALCSALCACSPYPDEGEFLAGVVYSGNFLAGVKTLRTLPATGRHRGLGDPPLQVLPYTVLASSGTSGASVSTSMAASSPIWADNGRRDPLDPKNAQQVFVFDNDRNCVAPEDARPYDPRWDLVDPARQYPIFTDLPEVLSGMGGRAGRMGAYSAIVEVVRIQTPAGYPCQSVKRADTLKDRMEADLRPAGGDKEYRLLLIVDTQLTIPPLPYQLGWFNQLVVPYIDMGPVPLAPGGQRFATMPIYNVVVPGTTTPVLRVVPGSIEEAPGALGYSPVCHEVTVPWPGLDPANPATYPPSDATGPGYPAYPGPPPQQMLRSEALSACIVCYTTAGGKSYQCPLSTSRAGAR